MKERGDEPLSDDAAAGHLTSEDALVETGIVEPTVIDVSDQATRSRPRIVGSSERGVSHGSDSDPGIPPAAEAESTDSNERPLANRVAVVTGGSSGIGRAIAIALGRAGARVIVIGRDVARLRETVASAPQPNTMFYLQCDLGSVSEIESVADFVGRTDRPLDLLVHCAGVLVQRGVGVGDVADLDEQYLVNLRGPYVLTQKLMAQVQSAQGHVVFINSTDGRTAVGGNAQHAMTKHGLTALADSLREEVSAAGVTVTSVYPGRTATPRTERLYSEWGLEYVAEQLLSPEDVALAVVSAAVASPGAEVTNISLEPPAAGEWMATSSERAENGNSGDIVSVDELVL